MFEIGEVTVKIMKEDEINYMEKQKTNGHLFAASKDTFIGPMYKVYYDKESVKITKAIEIK